MQYLLTKEEMDNIAADTAERHKRFMAEWREWNMKVIQWVLSNCNSPFLESRDVAQSLRRAREVAGPEPQWET